MVAFGLPTFRDANGTPTIISIRVNNSFVGRKHTMVIGTKNVVLMGGGGFNIHIAINVSMKIVRIIFVYATDKHYMQTVFIVPLNRTQLYYTATTTRLGFLLLPSAVFDVIDKTINIARDALISVHGFSCVFVCPAHYDVCV